MRFYLGTHKGVWLSRLEGVPLFVSRRTLAEYRRVLPRAVTDWALDSGGFTELGMNGRWSLTPAQYADEVDRYRLEVGRLDWAAPMDWMCEPGVLRQTGLRVADHQQRTVENFLELRELLGPLVIPVVQGWTLYDYLECVGRYAYSGVELDREPVVGVGSICRRGQDDEIAQIVAELARYGLRMHGFGLRSGALARTSDALASADSMAWSARARRDAPLPGCTHASCQNCARYALRWRSRLLARADQPRLFHRLEVPA